MTGPDLYALYAATQGAPDGWRWYSLRCVSESRESGGVLIKGAVCTAVYARGKRKGDHNWSKRDKSTERELFATFAQLEACRTKWERDTGKCSTCGGDGQELASVGVNGATYRPCEPCKATGVRQEKP
jgi:hypothetical protein